MDATANGRISIFVNGKPTAARAGATVAALLDQLGVDPAKVAVEMNRRIVRKTEWDATIIEDGAEVEVVHFVGGGADTVTTLAE